MKVVLLVIVASIATLSAQDTNDGREKLPEYRAQCIAESKVSIELIEKLDKGDFGDDQKLKCFTKCFYQKVGFVDENGELLADKIKDRIRKEKDADKLMATFDKCKHIKGDDPCDNVYQVHRCIFGLEPVQP